MEPETAQPAPAPGGAPTGTRVIGAILLVLGVAFVALGAIYLTLHANQLPSWLGKVPGRLGRGHRNKRGVAALIVAALLLIASGFALTRPRRPNAA